MCPQNYQSDTMKVLGSILPHDDSVNDRTPGSKLDTSNMSTKDLWRGMRNQFFGHCAVW